MFVYLLHDDQARVLGILNDLDSVAQTISLNLSELSRLVNSQFNQEPALFLIRATALNAKLIAQIQKFKLSESGNRVHLAEVVKKAWPEDSIQRLARGTDLLLSEDDTDAVNAAFIRAYCRRVSHATQLLPSSELQETLCAGALELNPAYHRIFIYGEEINLPLTCYKILKVLMSNSEAVYSRAELVKLCCKASFTSERTIDVHINHLRNAILSSGVEIKTIRGFGYRLVVPAKSA